MFEEAPGDESAAPSLGAVPFLTCWLEHLSAGSALFTLRVAWSN